MFNPIEAADLFINKKFPNCQGALLAGSVVRGEATETSDLDIVIFDSSLKSSYRESLIDFGWKIEVFAHNFDSYLDFFKSDRERARPSMPRMVSEGIVLKDIGIIQSIKQEAKELLDEGPEKWSTEMINFKRYFITDMVDDFIGSSSRGEAIFIANALAELVSEFVLRTNCKWIGTSKWVVRALRQYDENFAEYFISVFDDFYKMNKKQGIIELVDTILKPHGGRLFDGFMLGEK